ncbi:MAG: PDZ domain-containing protein, partial [Ignavibacterium sp.]
MKSIKAYIIKNKVNLVKIITLFLGLIAIANIYITLKINVTSNDECLWIGKKVSADSVAYFFTNVKVDGVAWQAGIRDGDQLLKINDYVVRNDQVAQSVLNLVSEGKYADYLVKKPNGTIVQTKVKIKKLIAFGTLTFVISSLFWLIIGFVVFTAKPDGKQQKLFFLVGVLFVFSSFFNLFPQTANLFEFISEHLILSLIIYTLASIGVSALPFAFLYFIWIFFKPLKVAQKRWIKVLFIVLSCLAFSYSVFLLTDLFKMSPDFFMESRKYQNFMNLINAITNSIAGITLIVIYLKEKDKQARKPILLILLSFVLAFAIQIYISTIAPVLADTIFNSPEYYAPVILLILVPIIFAYAIFKYHLLDMSAVVMNTVFYSVATATVVAIYFLSVYGLGHSLSNLFGVESQGIIAIILFTIFAIKFQSTKDKALKIITQKFYPEQFAYQNVL